MNRIIFTIIATLSLLPNDNTTQVNSKADYNGDDCALIKVNLPLSGCVFEGIFGDATKHRNEYCVF